MYHGTWNDTAVVFDRMFRGYRFRPEECEALCNGEMLHVFGLSRGGTTYGVLGALIEPNRKQFVKTDNENALLLEFKVFDVLVDDPVYDFSNRTVVFLDDYLAQQNDFSDAGDTFVSHGLDTAASVAGSVLDEFSDKSDAELSAMIAYQDKPKIKPTKYVVHDNVRVFVPVYIGVPGFDPDYESNKDIDFAELADQEDALESGAGFESDDLSEGLEDVGELVGGFGFDMDTGETTAINVLHEEEAVSLAPDDSGDSNDLGSDRSDDFAGLEYADESELGIMYDPLADEPYDPEESELVTDYEED